MVAVFDSLCSSLSDAVTTESVRRSRSGVLLELHAQAAVDVERRDRCCDELVADAGARRDEVVDVLELVFEELQLAERVDALGQRPLVAPLELQPIDRQGAVVGAAQVEALELPDTACLRIVRRLERDVEVGRRGVAAVERKPESGAAGPWRGRRRGCGGRRRLRVGADGADEDGNRQHHGDTLNHVRMRPRKCTKRA